MAEVVIVGGHAVGLTIQQEERTVHHAENFAQLQF